jgi:hypothetical protein
MQASDMLTAYFAESTKRTQEFEAFLQSKDNMAMVVTLLSSESLKLAKVHEATMALVMEFSMCLVCTSICWCTNGIDSNAGLVHAHSIAPGYCRAISS